MIREKIGVMCGSSDACPNDYLELAKSVGIILAENNRTLIYGGGAKGLMKRVADGVIENAGTAIGYMPEFMTKVEWQHQGLTQLIITKDMAERKRLMMEESQATIFLPGGCGTMEEFFEWFSAKRLGAHTGPLIIYNYDDYYTPLIKLLDNMQSQRFHGPQHAKMCSVCTKLEDLIDLIDQTPEWPSDAINYASVSLDK